MVNRRVKCSLWFMAFCCGGSSCCEAWAVRLWASGVGARERSSCGLRAPGTGPGVVVHKLSCPAV